VAATDVIEDYLGALPGPARRAAPGEWGLTVAPENAAGWPLDVGLRLADGLLTVKAHALSDSEGLDPWMLLWWNRATRLARFAGTESREVWVHADLPATAVSERELDRLLGLVVEGAVAIRELQAAKRARAAGTRGGWLEPEDEDFGPAGPDIID
jgi:hypothetical protein